MPRSNNTFVGEHWDDLVPFPVDTIEVDSDHRIKVYQFIGRETLLYVPQHRARIVGWAYYMQESNGSYDSWATFIKENAIKKCNK